MPDRPVWLNQPGEGPDMYTVVIQRPDTSKQPFIVFTRNGPIHAKAMAEHTGGGACLKSQQIPFPVITPYLHEVEHIIGGASKVMTMKRQRLQLFRFKLSVLGQRDPRIGFVWTTRGRKRASAFAEQAFMGKVTETYVVSNPILWEQEAAVAALADG